MRKLNTLNTLLVLICCLATLAYADDSQEPLPPDEAFALTATVPLSDMLRLSWQIADGYYLYQHKFAISSQTPTINLAKPSFPAAENKNDPFFGTVAIYRQQLTLDIPLKRQAATDNSVTIDVTFQGCADKGICYLPIHKTMSFDLANNDTH